MTIYEDFLSWDRVLFTRIAIAVPELAFEEDYMQYAVREGWIAQEDADEWKRRVAGVKKVKRIASGVKREQTILGRIMFLMPEILSIATVDLLRKIVVNGEPLISAFQGNALRAVLSGARILRPTLTSDATFLARVEAVFGAVSTSHVLNAVRSLDDAQIASIRRGMLIATGKDPRNGRLDSENAAIIRAMVEESVRRTQIARSVVSTGRILQESIKDAMVQRNVWSAMSVILDDMVGSKNGDKVLRNAVRAGVIDQEKYEVIRAMSLAGVNLWKKGVHASEYQSWVARTLIVGEGLISNETITALMRLKIISPEAALMLRPLAHLSRVVVRRNLENYMINTKFRVLPGESAIQTYGRLTARTDGEILRLLQDAARDTEKQIKELAKTKKFGAMTRAAQQRTILTSIHGGMHAFWENVGSLTIFGEREAARVALDATSYMMMSSFAGSGRDPEELARSLRYQAQAGIDAFISREENLYGLSRKVYKNIPLAMGQVQKEVKKGLIRGLSAAELAKNVRDMIDPKVPGGVSYAAMRLARTEINNAFHFSQIRYTREMPWVDGYKWNKSRSHPHVDICDERAQKNHDGLGRGVYKKRNVPGKAHPNCLCFITTVTADKGTFEKRLRSGAYDKFLKQAEKGNFGEGFERAKSVRDTSVDWAKGAGTIMAKAGAVSGAQKLEDFYRL